MKRVEKHKIKKNNKYFPFILEQLEQCKKISNSATFIIRQNFFFNKTKDSKGNEIRKYIKYNDMDRIFKRDRTELYRSLIYIQSVQQILRKVHTSFESFFKAIKDYKKKKSYKSNRLTRLRVKRNNIMNDYIHKTTRYIINYCKENNIDTIVIGNNKFQKQNKKKKQLKGLKNFIQVPIKRIIEQLRYKLEYENIRLIETEESYTSKTSFLDNEMPNKETIPKGKRIKRGIFKRPNGELVNSDVNGSLQILSKVISTKLLEQLRVVVSSNGLALNPLKIAL